MEREEDFEAGDRNSGNGNSREQLEASAQVFEDGQVRDTTGPIRQEKDAESYVYGDSRPDKTESSDTFTDIGESPMVTTNRETFPEVHKEDPAVLEAHRVDRQDHIEARYRRIDDGEEAVLVPGGREGGNEEL